MEDSHTEILSLREDKGTAFFGVYDGHGGKLNKLFLMHQNMNTVQREENCKHVGLKIAINRGTNAHTI